MNEKAKGQYKKRYLKLANRLDSLMQVYDCGINLVSFINPEIGIVQQQLDNLVTEISREINS